MIPAVLKKFAAFGSGIGIEIAGPRGSESLRITAVRVRPAGVRVLGRLTIEDFPHQPAGVWGSDYAAFLRKLDLRHVPATVLVPRQDVILRQLSLPGVGDKDLDSAIRFQFDGLHPYPEDDVISSWARLLGTSTVLIAIARRAEIGRYATAFSEAGVKLGGFTCSAAAIHSSLRLFGQTPPSPTLLFEENDGALELYGESPAHPLFSARFDSSAAPRAAELACAELRIEPGTEPKPLASAFPTGISGGPVLPYCAALASACPRLSLALNLLPAERRDTSSRSVWIPATALAVLVAMLAGTLFAMPAYQDHRYERSLQSEIAKVEPGARRAAAVERDTDTLRKRTILLDDFRRRSKLDMDVLEEMTRLLPPQVWLNLLDLNRTQVAIAGETDQAAPLLKLIDGSPYFEASEFLVPPTRAANGETFRIRTNREAGR
jgi:Tfp pilus assembly protein PilN